ncbi:MAG: Hint domain-containing protein [Roseovarius sp.]|nr:Hint domain-containing protein [Roseovarius sp.]
MARYSVWILEESNITVSGGVSLDGITQGDGSHLVGETITLNNNDWLEVAIRDRGSDTNFDDNDDDQRLAGSQTIDGVRYSNNTVVEAEYRIVLQDSDGNTYEAIGFNVNNSSPAYATVEGLAFIGPPQGWPPVGEPLTVISAHEGPGDSGQPVIPVDDLVVPCFTPGTLIDTPRGRVPVETLAVGDTVTTLGHGAQAIRWLGRVTLGAGQLAAAPRLRPIRLRAGALGPGRPDRDMLLSPQHRLMVGGWRAELHFGEAECLIAACHLVDRQNIAPAWDVQSVTYIHFLFDRHEIVFADGLATESFLPGPMTLDALSEQSRNELLELFPDLAGNSAPRAARPLIKGWEARLLASGAADA